MVVDGLALSGKRKSQYPRISTEEGPSLWLVEYLLFMSYLLAAEACCLIGLNALSTSPGLI
jgi:hypothetical protein